MDDIIKSSSPTSISKVDFDDVQKSKAVNLPPNISLSSSIHLNSSDPSGVFKEDARNSLLVDDHNKPFEKSDSNERISSELSNFDIISGAFNVELINSIIGRQRALNASDINENSSDINENSAERSLSILCKHIESDPKLFVSTILNTSVNQIAGVSPNEVDIHLLSIINLFRDHDHLHVLLNPLMTEELNTISSTADLFRKNSNATRVMTMYCRVLGRSIIENTVNPAVQEVLGIDRMLELDPSKVSSNELALSRRLLRSICKDILRGVIGNISPTVDVLCHLIFRIVEKRFPNSGHFGICNLLFLRFVCPAITCPPISNMTPRDRRALILVGKIVKSVASLHYFGEKDECMQVMNPFMEQVIPIMATFYQGFSESNRQKINSSSKNSFQPDSPKDDTNTMSDSVCIALDVGSEMETISPAWKHVCVVRRKQASLQRILEYLERLSRFPEAVASIPGAKSGWVWDRNISPSKRVMPRLRSNSTRKRFMVSSPLHQTIFYYKLDCGEMEPVQSISFKNITEFSVREAPKPGRPRLELSVIELPPETSAGGAVSPEEPSPTNMKMELDTLLEAHSWARDLKEMQCRVLPDSQGSEPPMLLPLSPSDR